MTRCVLKVEEASMGVGTNKAEGHVCYLMRASPGDVEAGVIVSLFFGSATFLLKPNEMSRGVQRQNACGGFPL